MANLSRAHEGMTHHFDITDGRLLAAILNLCAQNSVNIRGSHVVLPDLLTRTLGCRILDDFMPLKTANKAPYF